MEFDNAAQERLQILLSIKKDQRLINLLVGESGEVKTQYSNLERVINETIKLEARYLASL